MHVKAIPAAQPLWTFLTFANLSATAGCIGNDKQTIFLSPPATCFPDLCAPGRSAGRCLTFKL